VLDIAVHAKDIEVLPGIFDLKLGSGLYNVPAMALVVETLYGIFCWWVFGGSRKLLGVIVAFNLAAISFYVPQIAGPEMFLAGHPKFFASVILVHIISALVAIAYFAKPALVPILKNGSSTPGP
jgi:hypothetical protein